MCWVFIVIAGCHPYQSTPGKSKSLGNPGNGTLVNGVKLPYKYKNFKYFSPFSYFVLNRAYVNDKVYNTLMQTYAQCEKEFPRRRFGVMECSKKNGGPIVLHRTHQNGLSVDFMTPFKRKNKEFKLFNKMGIWHYTLRFDQNGKNKLFKKVVIDFELLANFIFILEKKARVNGLKIKKVILKTDLKDEIIATEYGKKLKKMGVYFVIKLPKVVNNQHDEHIHVDFEEL